MASNTYYLTDEAESDIDSIFEYITYTLENPDAATNFANNLEEVLDELCKVPKKGRPAENEYITREDTRFVMIGNYKLYYVYEKDDHLIVVLRVVYSKRNPKNIVIN